MSVNLGPIAPGSPSLKVPANPQRDGLGHNPSEFSFRSPLEPSLSLFFKTEHVSHSNYSLSLRKQASCAGQLIDRPRMSPTGYQQI